MTVEVKASVGQPLKSAFRRLRPWLMLPARPAILMYHQIGAPRFDPWGLAVEEGRFEAQLEWLARHRSVLPLSGFARQQAEGSLPRNAIAITFDDAYASAIRRALPLLRKHGLPTTIFVPAELIRLGRAFWWDELAEIVFAYRGKTISLNDLDVPVPDADAQDGLWPPQMPAQTPRQRLFQSLWSKLKQLRHCEREHAIAALRTQASPVDQSSDRPAAPEELRAVNGDLVEFGSHARTHSSLPALEREAKVQEVEQSREDCLRLTGSQPTAFSYPYGDYDAESVRMVEQAGYSCAVTSEPAFVTLRNGVFALPRIPVGNWHAAQLRQALRGG